ncbi:unnamed protein product [Auanema sp. JU1783]|nr:unnamed protein product [Auanema sp. JU1783]
MDSSEQPGIGKSSLSSILTSPFCPTYDGTHSLKDFVNKFNKYANVMGFNVPQKLAISPFLLKAEGADEIYESIPGRLRDLGPWDELILQLSKKLCPPSRKDDALLTLQAIQQKEMTVNAFAAKLNQLGLIAFDHTDHHRDNVLRDAFLGGLNENIRREVQRAKPKTYREAVEAARFEEGILRRGTQEDFLINALNKALTPFTQQLENTERSLRNMENNPWRETREPKNQNFTRGFGRRPFNERRNGFYPKNNTNSYRGYQPNAYNRERHETNQLNNNTNPNFQRLPNPNSRGLTNEDSRGDSEEMDDSMAKTEKVGSEEQRMH